MTWPTIFDIKLNEYDAMEMPGQQLPASLASTPLDHLLNLNVYAPPPCQRLTGIMAAMGPSTNNLEVLEKMIEAGMNIAFLNMTFGAREEHVEMIKLLRQAAINHGTNFGKLYPLAIAVRLTGRKIRTGRIADSYGDSVELVTGESVKLTTDETYKDRCSPYTVYVDFMYFAEQLKKGDYVLLDNETISLRVEVISATTLTCNIERGGFLGSHRDVFVPNVAIHMPNYSEKDILDIKMAIDNQVDIIIAPFIEDAAALIELRSILGNPGKKISLVANIQTNEGYRHFDEIMEACNGIFITRQEFGSDISPKKLVIAQKNMIVRANKANVPICVSAHILSSMIHSKVPLRAELLDISNCIIDGVDCLVLGPETAVGSYPVETVHVMAGACKEAEACIWTRKLFYDFIDKTAVPCDQSTCIAMAGVMAAQRCIAAAMVVITTSGRTAEVVAKYKPRCPILAVTRYHQVARRLHLFKGVVPLVYEDPPESVWVHDVESRISFAVKFGMEKCFIRVGDPIIVICGWRQGTGFTNTMKIIYAVD